jgi:hypothetical protein
MTGKMKEIYSMYASNNFGIVASEKEESLLVTVFVTGGLRAQGELNSSPSMGIEALVVLLMCIAGSRISAMLILDEAPIYSCPDAVKLRSAIVRDNGLPGSSSPCRGLPVGVVGTGTRFAACLSWASSCSTLRSRACT